MLDVIGKRFGRLVVVELLERRTNCGKQYVVVRCDCGIEKDVLLRNLNNEDTKSCGCLQRELAAKAFTTHGLMKTAAYKTWREIHRRCNNPRSARFERYGGRGIGVCDRWKDFANFYEDMGDRPAGMSIDRIDNDGNYEPSNCRWSTAKEQSRNRSNNRLITYNGKTMSVSEWAELIGLLRITLHKRLKSGWSIKDALEKPLRNRVKS